MDVVYARKTIKNSNQQAQSRSSSFGQMNVSKSLAVYFQALQSGLLLMIVAAGWALSLATVDSATWSSTRPCSTSNWLHKRAGLMSQTPRFCLWWAWPRGTGEHSLLLGVHHVTAPIQRWESPANLSAFAPVFSNFGSLSMSREGRGQTAVQVWWSLFTAGLSNISIAPASPKLWGSCGS